MATLFLLHIFIFLLFYIKYHYYYRISTILYYTYHTVNTYTVTHKTESMFVLLDYSLNSFECKTYMKKVLVHQRKNLIRAMQPLKIM